MPTEDWNQTRADLVARLGGLADGEALILAEPDPVTVQAPRRGLFRGRPRPDVGRYVQFMRLGDELLCECIGPGFTTVDAAAEKALLAKGWRSPEDPTVRSENYEARLPITEVDRAAALAIDALQVLGVRADDLRWTPIPA